MTQMAADKNLHCGIVFTSVCSVCSVISVLNLYSVRGLACQGFAFGHYHLVVSDIETHEIVFAHTV